MRIRSMNRLYAYQGNVPSFTAGTTGERKRASKTAATVVALTLLVACGAPSISILKGTIAGFAPLVQVLVSQGKIKPDKAALYVADANKLADAFGVLATNFTGSNVQKAEAIRAFANTVAPITTDFAKVDQLALAIAILNSTISVIEAFYSPSPVPGASAGGVHSEKDLQAFINRKNAELKAALAH